MCLVGNEGIESLYIPDIMHSLLPYYSPGSQARAHALQPFGSCAVSSGLGEQGFYTVKLRKSQLDMSYGLKLGWGGPYKGMHL